MAYTNTSVDRTNPEPSPDWDEVESKLGFLWPAHVYFFASLFLILTMVAFVFLVRSRSLRENRFMSTVMLSAVFFLAASRSGFLFTDPYLSSESKSLWWITLCVVTFGLGTTSLTASISILLFVTTVSTRIGRAHHQTRLKRIVCFTTICHFTYFITSSLVVTFQPAAAIVLTICQITFAIWGIVMSFGFLVLTMRLQQNSKAGFEQARYNAGLQNESRQLRRLSILLLVLSATGMTFFALRIVEAQSSIIKKTKVESWTWWGLQTALRSLEVINMVVLLMVFRRRVQKANNISQDSAQGTQNRSTKATERTKVTFMNNSKVAFMKTTK